MPRRRARSNQPKRQLSHEDYKATSAALVSVRNKMKDLREEEARLKERILDFVNQMPKNSDGSYTDVLSFANGVTFDVTYSPRKKVVFVDNAMDLIEEWGLSEHVIRDVPVIDEDWVKQAYQNGELTDEQLAEMTEEKITYQLSIKQSKD